MRRAVTCEALELDDELQPMAPNLDVIFEMLHTEMMKELRKCGRREPSEALLFWKRQNESQGMIIPKPFNMVAKAFCLLRHLQLHLSAYLVLSALGKIEGNQAKDQLILSLIHI